jgi:hypothetical protein
MTLASRCLTANSLESKMNSLLLFLFTASLITGLGLSIPLFLLGVSLVKVSVDNISRKSY